MNKKNVLVVAVLIIVAVLFTNFYFLSASSCTAVEKIEATLTVKRIPDRLILGLNADTDALRFGVVSPGIAAMRKITIQHSKEAVVKAGMEGELAYWTSISPAEFNLSAGETREVAFEVNVPNYALPGNYSGTAVFCIREV